MEPVRMAVVDNDIWSAQSIAHWLAAQPLRYAVAWATVSPAEAIHHCMVDRLPPQVLLLDMALGSTDGRTCCERIRRLTADIAILGMTAYDCAAYRDDLAAAGAQGIIPKERLTVELPRILPAVAHGGSCEPGVFPTTHYAHRHLEEDREDGARRRLSLSTREREVLACSCRGLEATRIAEHTGLSVKSVYTYMRRVTAKLGVASYADAVRWGQRYDLG